MITIDIWLVATMALCSFLIGVITGILLNRSRS